MANLNEVNWTNKSVLRLAKGTNPIEAVERKARELVLRARDAGWPGPPFDPIFIADLLKIPVEANASVSDARIVSNGGRLVIQYNPTQARARVRFSIAHEIAHTLFPDVAAEVRNRGGNRSLPDDWQLEVLCNLAAAEFVMPSGSMPSTDRLASIEQLMIARKDFDVSAEAFLIRATKMTKEPVLMFCASGILNDDGSTRYRVDYTVGSKADPNFHIAGQLVPMHSVVHMCTAIGYTDKKSEKWFSREPFRVECVGIPAYLGRSTPRVAGIIRFGNDENHDALKVVHGDVLDPRGTDVKVICQLVNDQARFWGGGVAKATGRKFPHAQKLFAEWVSSTPRGNRLGSVHFAEAANSVFIASLVGQEGFGPSSEPRIRYAALERCLDTISEFASRKKASVHMPRLGAGQSGGDWETVEEIVRNTLILHNINVTVYDLPPKKRSQPPGLFA